MLTRMRNFARDGLDKLGVQAEGFAPPRYQAILDVYWNDDEQPTGWQG